MAKAKAQQETKKQSNEQGKSQQQTEALQRREEGQQATPARREQWLPSTMRAGSPFTFMRRFAEEMDRLFEDFGLGRGLLAPTFGRGLLSQNFGELTQGGWSPQVEVFERDGKLVVRADLPGVSKDDIKVEVTGDAITIEGERHQEHEEQGEGYYRCEMSHGGFYRQIPLPEGINADEADATFRDGVLEITMPAPARQTRGRRLEIQEGSAGQEKTQARAQTAGQKR